MGTSLFSTAGENLFCEKYKKKSFFTLSKWTRDKKYVIIKPYEKNYIIISKTMNPPRVLKNKEENLKWQEK